MCGAVGAAGGGPVQQTMMQMPGQVAGESGSGTPAQKTDVAGESGTPTQANVGQQALGGGGGDLASVLASLVEQLKALASQVAGISGGGPGQVPSMPPLPNQIPTGPPGKTGANPGQGKKHDSDVAGARGHDHPGQAPGKHSKVGGEKGDGDKSGPPAKK